MYKNLFKFAVMTITILTANLLTSKISEFLIGYHSHYNVLTRTLIIMAIVTIILYPLYAYLQKWLTALSKKIIRSGSSVAGKYVGLVLAFLICIAVLLCFYAQMWYHINVFHLLTSGKIGMYF